MRRLMVYAAIGGLTCWLGILAATGPRFVRIFGNNFKSAGSPAVFMDDCPGCGEIGNIRIDDERADPARGVSVGGRCGRRGERIVERGRVFGPDGKITGERCVALAPGYAKIVRFDGERVLTITVAAFSETHLALAREFEASAEFENWLARRKN
ncbi:MAG: hypothetical protein JSS81_13930 [Acidobacteria bacterium]|nr:hypothetical protein [Acidobacteriota bacterium]